MVCKVLFYDLKNSEKPFFKVNPENFDIKIFSKSLNRKTVNELSEKQLKETSALNVFTPSLLSSEVINKFSNLRVIVVRSKNIKHVDLKTCLDRNIALVSAAENQSENDLQIVAQSFRMITDVLCGCKECRII
ncbi:MAG: hypothetical protein SPL73_04335 [Cyanobacteriota bacterium]|nr:hypothetical protein [Cyanobacteriota bacterium]MDY6359404.1 hypothetical protein [Cyanobacteriota bacterium]MDY6364100.1 hypothetical protein [Cyanobacteriota bacterium]MDY6383696.1 hypothetical protein [Cyanobacteriota bacterium]